VAGQPDWKAAPRIEDKDAQPHDGVPLLTGVCPLCERWVGRAGLSRHHVVPKGRGGAGGDDLPENLVWVCGDGTRGCHGVLTHRGRGDHGLPYEQVALRLLRYLARFPAYVSYASRKRHHGWAVDYYLRGDLATLGAA
jgi:hypothetical protein